jgi:predicted nucleotidyltransferase component of viral defense system
MFTSATQLKDYIKNKSKQTGANSNILLQNYIMERFLERLSLSDYRENMILKGGFLIAAMVGIGKRSTMDMDATVKGLPMNRLELEKVLREIIVLDVGDGVSFELNDIKNIRDISEYDDYRVSMRATLFTVRVDMKIDFTTGDVIIPREIEYPYKLMFEDRTIPVMAYNLNTVLAEKIETIISRGVGNTRGRDYYDIYVLLAMEKDKLSRSDLLYALRVKADERGSLSAMDDHTKIINDIAASPDIANIWESYKKRYTYAKGIKLSDILTLLSWVFADE